VIKEGFTLDTADTIIFLNSSYIYTDNIQCMDRLVPVSQENVHKITQNIIILLAKDSIDEYIYDMVYNKKASSSDIVNNYKNYRKETLCNQDLQQSKLKDLN
jgi:SNF2 family DNA or RNA helicase